MCNLLGVFGPFGPRVGGVVCKFMFTLVLYISRQQLGYMCNLLGVFGPFQIYFWKRVSHNCFDQPSYLFIWCQIGSGVKFVPVSNWLFCTLGVKLVPVSNWLLYTLGVKLVPVSNWLFYTLGVKLSSPHSWCQIDSGVKLVPVSNCPPTVLHNVHFVWLK